jgi:hypothetical protein
MFSKENSSEEIPFTWPAQTKGRPMIPGSKLKKKSLKEKI